MLCLQLHPDVLLASTHRAELLTMHHKLPPEVDDVRGVGEQASLERRNDCSDGDVDQATAAVALQSQQACRGMPPEARAEL